MRTELGPHRSLVVWLLSTAHFQHTSKTFTSSALFIVLTPNIIASCWAFTYPSLYFAKHFMNIVKPSAGKVAHRIWWAAASILMKCSASRLFRTITPPPHLCLKRNTPFCCSSVTCDVYTFLVADVQRVLCCLYMHLICSVCCDSGNFIWLGVIHLKNKQGIMGGVESYIWLWSFCSDNRF